ncbi:MAG TPA: hypothetical protein ENI82_03600 [Bacteroidetes bacterium]|nr:hypothetical protein [Bacteroidota bacterium]
MKKTFLKIISILALTFVLQMTCPSPVQAQCPMCKIAAESDLKNGGTQGKGLNTGILFLLMMPYVLVLGIAVVWYKNRKPESEIEFD